MLILISTILLSGDEKWQLKKSGDYFKAYTKGGSDKFYRIEADLDCEADSVFSFLTDFENFPEIYENTSSLEILSSSDSATVHYSVISAPWPFEDRDMVTKVVTHRSEGKTVIRSKSYIADSHKPVKNRVRINDFEEQIEIFETKNYETRLEIEGRIKLNEKLPGWLLNKLILSGPLNTVELIKKKYERRKN